MALGTNAYREALHKLNGHMDKPKFSVGLSLSKQVNLTFTIARVSALQSSTTDISKVTDEDDMAFQMSRPAGERTASLGPVSSMNRTVEPSGSVDTNWYTKFSP